MKGHGMREQRQAIRRVVGMMSGTSVDGIDAALVEISQSACVKLLAFENKPFPPAVREKIFSLFRPETAPVDRGGYMNFLLGELYAEAALSVIAKAGFRPEEVDLIGSHGQTIWHAPEPSGQDGYPIRYTVQIGEGAVIAARTGVPVVSDFRVADMALGGQGAPLVPFTEYLLYRREDKTMLLQNIGGIGNMTVLPAAARPEDVFAFDTGPGNMIIDAVTAAVTGGRQTYDAGGAIAARGRTNEALLARLRENGYYALPLPKTTGRERFGAQYTAEMLAWPEANGLSPEDLLATVTELTAWSIADAYERYVLPWNPRNDAGEFGLFQRCEGGGRLCAAGGLLPAGLRKRAAGRDRRVGGGCAGQALAAAAAGSGYSFWLQKHRIRKQGRAPEGRNPSLLHFRTLTAHEVMRKAPPQFP